MRCLGLLLVAGLLATACVDSGPEGSGAPVGTVAAATRTATPAGTAPTAALPTLTPTGTAPTAALPTATATEVPPAGERAEVTRVVDGDTIDVLMAGTTYRIRYIGIDTPETVDPRRPVQCYGREASQRNRELVEGKTVELEKDVSETDEFGRLLRYVWVAGEMANATLVREGYAVASTYPPDVKHQELFLELQREAIAAGRGLWSACASPTASAIAQGVCDYSGTTQAVIKGNISQTTGEKIYHVPGGEFYDKTVVDEAAGERWFCTEQEAAGAGWRRSKR